MMDTKKVTLIGSGNFAWHLTHWFYKSPFEIVEICSRNIEKDAADFHEIDSQIQFIDDFTKISTTSDIYILCIPDDDLDFLILDWPFVPTEHQILLHGSGTKMARLFIETATNYGVFWPIQTLRKKIINNLPPSIVMTANNDFSKNILEAMARVCTNHYQFYNDYQKRMTHLAATVANNFTNHLWGKTKEYCDVSEIDFTLLHNIILETAQRAVTVDHPYNVQTGPAIRNDQDTIERHLKMLNQHLDLKRIYQILNHSIELKRDNK